MKELEVLSTTGKNVEWYSTYKQYGSLVIKLKAEITHDLAILILGAYSREWKARVHLLFELIGWSELQERDQG